MAKNFLFILLFCFSTAMAQDTRHLKLWFTSPANAGIADDLHSWTDDPEWLKALPLGNGSIGAMVFGDVNKERIQLNEKTLSSGSPDSSDNPEAFNSLGKIRELLFAGKYKEASELTHRTQICKGPGSAYANAATVPFGCFQTLGDLWLDFEKENAYTDYYRELDINTAVAKLSYRQDGILYKREVFVSNPAQSLIIHFTASKKGSLSFSCTLNRPEHYTTTISEGQVIMKGKMNNGKGGDGMEYMVRLQAVLQGGRQQFSGDKIIIQNADEVTLILTAATDYLPVYPSYTGRKYEKITRDVITNAIKKSYTQLKTDHTKDYQQYFSRVSLQLADKHIKDSIPTDERLKRFKQNPSDNYLEQLYFQYGRYLLISSSRSNTLPANLQGIWANKIQTAWNGDYHTDINVQMNYWLAEVTNLPEIHLSLVKYIQNLQQPAQKTAQIQYHAGGWCVHPITNVWGFTSPGENAGWGLHIAAGGWLCQHLWEHYLFSMDKNYLRQVFPVLKTAALFYTDWLVKDKETGLLVSGPSTSPENAFVAPDSSKVQISMGPAHDQEIIHELFTNVIAAAEQLGMKEDDTLRLIKADLKNLMPVKVAADGRLMEWAHPFEETEPGHRHLSHLYSLYPGNEFNFQQTPELAIAAGKSLEYRLAHGGGYTGWSAAWVINLWARLGEGNKAFSALQKLLSNNTSPNLFDVHPPFQIDGNFGATSGIAELLLQSHAGFIELLPALPDTWKREGEVKGLKARGNYTIDIAWKNGIVTDYKIRAKKAGKVKVKVNGKMTTLMAVKG
ncbi:MAG: glycoside hydrolase family 95 protein [Bacteroidota bacterium]